ncbi:hypothetical protein CDL12_29030 [Handroanthus impetiginosus]|uniref:BZIP domain-containing protein n=1 Tax=Handroanthus impetiginosus TaxID=429701 RepID=A0A2G9FZM1_9LAMI|nr:hypothetical protein CDL12_29030 [Handroanthus impetiginosus]
MKFEDLVDLYINNGGQNASQTTGDQYIDLLEDFNEFESTLPPDELEGTHRQSRNGFNIDKEIQESEIMIKEMVEDTSQNVDGSFPAYSKTMNINSHVTYIRYGDLNYNGAAGDIIASVFGGGHSENVFGSVMRFLKTPCVNENGKERTRRRKRVKRKYRGVVETEEETARRMEMMKIKNREAAAKAHANRQARETYVQAQLSKLQRKNEFLKKMVKFLQGQKKINLHPQPLRRTFSVPLGISLMDI